MSAYVNSDNKDEELKTKFRDAALKMLGKQIQQDIKTQEKSEEKYTAVAKPIIEKLQAMTPVVEKSSEARNDATLIGSMTGTGPGYSWSNAPGRLATAGEQLIIPVGTGISIITGGVAPLGGILVGLGRAVARFG